MPPKRVTVNQVLTQIFHGDENILESDENIVKIVRKDKQLSGIPRRRSVEEVLTDLWAEDSDNEIFNNLDVSVSGDPRQNSYMAGEDDIMAKRGRKKRRTPVKKAVPAETIADSTADYNETPTPASDGNEVLKADMAGENSHDNENIDKMLKCDVTPSNIGDSSSATVVNYSGDTAILCNDKKSGDSVCPQPNEGYTDPSVQDNLLKSAIVPCVTVSSSGLLSTPNINSHINERSIAFADLTCHDTTTFISSIEDTILEENTTPAISEDVVINQRQAFGSLVLNTDSYRSQPPTYGNQLATPSVELDLLVHPEDINQLNFSTSCNSDDIENSTMSHVGSSANSSLVLSTEGHDLTNNKDDELSSYNSGTGDDIALEVALNRFEPNKEMEANNISDDFNKPPANAVCDLNEWKSTSDSEGLDASCPHTNEIDIEDGRKPTAELNPSWQTLKGLTDVMTIKSSNLDLEDGNIKLFITVYPKQKSLVESKSVDKGDVVDLDMKPETDNSQPTDNLERDYKKGKPQQASLSYVSVVRDDADSGRVALSDIETNNEPAHVSYPQQFHAPSFGDEEFQIPPILPEDSLPFSSALNDSSGFETCQSLDSIFTNEQGSVQPKFPPQNIDIPDITETNLQHNVVPSSSYLPMDQSLHSRNMLGEDGSLSGSNQTSPLRDGSSNSEDSDDLPLSKLATGLKKPAAAPALGRKPKAAKKKNKKKKKDPNEPQKPVSAYALFFRDTQAAIKGQNQNATFGEVSKIVASMWDSLDPDSKESYKKRTETAKKLYLQKLAAYRASLVSQQSPLDIIDRQRERLINTTPIPQAIGQLKKYPLRTRPNKVMSPSSSSASSSPEHSLSPPHMSPQHNNDLSSLKDYHGNHIHSPEHAGRPHNLCTRNGCQNIAVCNTGWDNEYCSNECVVSHCRDVFTAWVVSRQQSANNYMQVN